MLDFYEQFHAREPANVSFMRFPASAEGIGNVADTVFVHVFHSKKAFQITSTFIAAFILNTAVGFRYPVDVSNL